MDQILPSGNTDLQGPHSSRPRPCERDEGTDVLVLPRLIHLVGEPVVSGHRAHAVGEDHDGRVAIGLVCKLSEGGEI